MNNPTNTLLTGAAAGALGTLAMDLLWFRRARQAGTDDVFADWEFTGEASFDDAGAPAQVGQEAASAVGVQLPDRAGGLTNDVVHWLTGTGWGVAGSLLASVTGLGPVAAGLTSGAAAFTAAYTVLPAIGIYDPIWNYDGKTLWKDATAHATFGAATGIALGVLRRLSGRSSG
ncbi:hypothetical protein BH23ACT9_BH23ACT9_17500 [soil metagenome]